MGETKPCTEKRHCILGNYPMVETKTCTEKNVYIPEYKDKGIDYLNQCLKLSPVLK